MSLHLPKYVYVGTWALRPAASGHPVGSVMYITDFGNAVGSATTAGVASGSEWVSNGVYWKPLNGKVALYMQSSSMAAPIATLTGNGTVQFFTLPASILLPAGMLFPGAQLEVFAKCHKVGGTHTGTFAGVLEDSAAPASITANDFASPSANAATDALSKIAAQVTIYAGGFLEGGGGGGHLPFTQGNNTAVPIDNADANILTEARYIAFGIGTSWTDNTADLVHYQVSLVG